MSDTGPLVHLAKVSSLQTLRALYSEIVIPTQVKVEAVDRGKEKGSPDAIQIEKAIDERWIQVKALRTSAKFYGAARVAGLQVAEIAVIQYAYRTKALVLLDDEPARVFARTLSIAVRGSLGIVLEALTRKLITKEECLGKLHKLSEVMYLSPAVYHLFRESVESI